MPDPVPGSRFRVYDIVTRIVPGSTLVVLWVEIITSYPSSELEYSAVAHMMSSTSALLIYLGIGLVFGEIIQTSRNWLHPVPYPFRRLLYHQSGDRLFLAKHDRWRLGIWDSLSSGLTRRVTVPIASRSPTSFFEVPDGISTKAKMGLWSDFKARFGLNDDFNDARDVYSLMLAYMSPKMTSDLERYRAVVDFISNLLIVTLILTYSAVFQITNTDISGVTIAALFVVFLMSVPMLLSFFGFLEREYINRLLLEYLLARKEEQVQYSGVS